MCSAVPEVNRNDDVTADKSTVLYEALQGYLNDFFKKQKHKTNELKNRK